MAYSTDLRKRVLDFIEAGGKKAEVSARRFSVERSTIYRWLAAEDPFSPQKPGPKNMRVLDEAALKKHVADCPRLDAKRAGFTFRCFRVFYSMGCANSDLTRKKKQSDIRSGAMRNVKSTVRHSPRNTPLAKDSLC